jgi:prepilin-type N-terminal cleavage/methylation domain-containing protein
MKSKLNRRRGFTIVEIIVAVVIMGALFTILVNSLGNARKRAERSTKQARVREDAVIYREEVDALISESFQGKKGADIAKYLKSRHDKDPYGQDYSFTITGDKLMVQPGSKAEKEGLHEEVIKLSQTAL